jgi:Ca2+-binding RTX toxin-like protein
VRFLPVLVFAFFLALPAVASADTTPTCAEGPTTVGGTTYGTPCSDTIVAPAGVEDVKAGGGNDTIVAAPIAATSPCPESCLFLGVGSQTFEGGEGDDVVFGERGNDILRGGPGNDQLFGGIGDDLLQGGPGDDRLLGGFGADSIDGEEGSDYVRGDSTIDRIFDTGSSGTDTLSYSTGVTPGFGDPADENGVKLELGASGENAKNGVAANGGGVDEVETGVFEVIVGTAFSDEIFGTGMGETIYGGGSADVIDGGGGADQIVQGAATRDTTKVSVGFMTPPGATPYAQLYLVGSTGGDKVSATYSSSAVTFLLTAGSFDQSASDAGGCELRSATEAVCQLGSMSLDSVLLAGMDGNDTIAASNFPSTVSVVAIGGEGDDSISGGEESEDILVDGPGGGADVLNALGGDDALTHNGGADELLGGNGNDLFLSNSVCDGERIVGGAGRDNASWARFGEGVEANLASGQAGRPGSGEAPDCGGEPLDGLSEIEDLEGSSFGDVFYGDAGPNQLLGHPGPDVYFAGPGEDSILANSGDADLTINCGPDNDSALVDFAQYGDPVPVECESVAEAEPNNFRRQTELPPPPLDEPPAVEIKPPVKKPPVVKPQSDKKPPQTQLGSHPRPRLLTHRKWRQVAFRFASSERGSSFRCKLDAKPYRPCTSPRAYRVEVGRHAFRVFAIDRAGNRDQTPALFKFRVRLRG